MSISTMSMEKFWPAFLGIAAASMTSYPDSSMQMMEKAGGALVAGAAKGVASAAAKFLNPIPDEIPDPSAQTPHVEEEWNLAGRDDPNTAAIEKALLKLMRGDADANS